MGSKSCLDYPEFINDSSSSILKIIKSVDQIDGKEKSWRSAVGGGAESRKMNGGHFLSKKKTSSTEGPKLTGGIC